MEIFRIENLEFTYPLTQKKALDGVTLTVNSGDFIVLCGKSGCGKSTLLRQLKPSISPKGEKSGKVYFLGEEITAIGLKEESQKIGFVMQNPESQLVCDKVWKELAFGLENLGMKNIDIRVRVAEIAAFFGLEDVFHKNVFELSGGQKQLLNLAAVMAMDPKVLVLDEPTSQLDPIAAEKFLDTIVKINRDLSITVIISEHNLENLLEYADKVAVMDKGKIVLIERPEKIARVIEDVEIKDAFPVAMRVFGKDLGKCPISLREGRRCLDEKIGALSPEEIPSNEQKRAKDTIFSFDNVWFRYEKDSEPVLRGFSATIKKGEIYSLVGGNAAGKSTLLKLAAGSLKPERGKVYPADKRFRIGMVPQNPRSLFVEKTLIDDFKREESDLAKIQNIAEVCKVEELLTQHPFDLSGGELQRAAIAKALLNKPQILFLDEPTKGMDVIFKKRLANLIKDLKNDGISIVMVTHDLDFCAEVSDVCGMLFDGQNLCEDNPRAFFDRKRFYTTAANRMAKDIINGAITAKDIINTLNDLEGEKNEKI